MPCATATRSLTRVEALRRAISKLKRDEEGFTGTSHAVSRRLEGVTHRQIENLLEGRTNPWKITVHTYNELIRYFQRYGLSRRDFKRPPVAVVLPPHKLRVHQRSRIRRSLDGEHW